MPDKEKLSFMQGGKIFGNVAGSSGQRLLQNNMDPGVLRPWIGDNGEPFITLNNEAVPVVNATLRKDEWKQYDTAILQAARQRLVGVADLYSRGLVYNIGNGLGTTVLEYEDMSDITDAQMNMDGVTRGKGDRPEFDISYLPLPIIHKDFHINIRTLNASRRTGAALDTTMAELAARKVAEYLETILFTGTSTFTFGGGTIYGYIDFPYNSDVTLNAHWDDSAATGASILEDVLAMKQASINDRYYGPWMLYIPTNFETAIDEDFKAASDKSIRQRLMEIDGLLGIRVADKLTADNVVLVQMTSDVVRMVQGMAITPIEWQTEGGMVFQYKVMTIQVPQLRADQNDRSGIVHGSK